MGARTIRPVPPLDAVKRELSAISNSVVFSHSARQYRLLEYLCNKVLLGEAEQIKATTIAMEVFGRPWSFDESKDAIVRVEAHRLRKKLAKYYEEGGTNHDIRIVLSPGGYVPEFVMSASSESPEHGDSSKANPPEEVSPSGLAPPQATGSVLRRRNLVLFGAVAAISVVVALLVEHNRGAVAAKSISSRGIGSVAGIAPRGAVRILAGLASGTYVDRFGRTWGADRYFSGGTVERGPKDFYGRPPDAGLFGTMRTGEFSYDIPEPPGRYELQLYWAEPIFRLENESNGGGEDERRFNVSVNGKPLLSAFDVVADSGISAVDVRAFKDVSPGADGLVHIRFSAAYGTPFVNALELMPTPSGRALPVRIRANELAFTDHNGDIWSPDDYYVGGRLATHKAPVTGTSEPGLFAGERYGNFNYVIPVPAGRYAVKLYFAETWFRADSTGQDKGGKGDRIFDVYCNGATLLKDLDVFAQAGSFHAFTRTFHGIRPNGQGKILLSFSPSRNYASVKAIEVISEP